MADLPTPRASRLKAPSWRDARLLVGVLLVLAATVAGSLAVAAADDRVPVYAAREPLVPGEALRPEQLARVDVQLGDRSGTYLSAAAPVPADRFVLREVRPGELVPVTAVGDRDGVSVQPLTLGVDATSATLLTVGTRVDVYVNPPAADDATGRRFAGPELVLSSVAVSRLPETGGRLGGPSAERAVQVMVPRAKVRDLIAQVDLGARVTLVPVPGSPVRPSS